MVSMTFCRVHINKTTAPNHFCSKYITISLWPLTYMGEQSPPCLIYLVHLILYTLVYCCFDCMIWVSEMPHWTGSDPIVDNGDNPLLHQWYTVIISKSVFRSAPGITTWPNILHPVYNPAGCNSAVISMEFSYANDIAIHGLQTKQYGIITPHDQ